MEQTKKLKKMNGQYYIVLEHIDNPGKELFQGHIVKMRNVYHDGKNSCLVYDSRKSEILDIPKPASPRYLVLAPDQESAEKLFNLQNY